MSGESSWWSLRDIELELGRPVIDAPLLIAVRELRREVDEIAQRIRVLAERVERLDAEAQEAIIERGDDPRNWSFEPEPQDFEPPVPLPKAA
jgi:hypothetical protein